MEQARREAVRMLDIAAKSTAYAVKTFIENDLKSAKEVGALEEIIDNLQSEITQYLVELSQRTLAEEESEELPVLIHTVNDVERIGDHAENIVELAERKIEQKLLFSAEAVKELTLMWNELNSMMIAASEALKKNDTDIASSVLKREAKIDRFQIELKKSHVNRLSEKSCDIQSGVVFMDFIDNLEKIGDHLTNIAQGVAGEMKWRGYRKQHERAESQAS